MVQFSKTRHSPDALPEVHPDTVRNMAAMTERLGLATVPAAWPTGVPQLAQAIGVCQCCDASEVCSDWLVRAPDRLAMPPAFCPNASTFARAKKA